MRVVIADDSMLIREGTARLLEDAGFDVVGKATDAQILLGMVALDSPEVAIVDIKMPPTHTDEGIVAAETIRRSYPGTAVLVLSQYLEAGYGLRLLEQHPERVGYLLKERVSDIAVLAESIRRLAEGECVLDPTIVSRLVNRPRPKSRLDDLTARERDVLALIAEGHSNLSISRHLLLSPKTIEAHVGRIFAKLGLGDTPDYHRRVLAVLAFLRS
jgi:DNA-binding NarL/FixJ family response regulator